MHRHSTQNFNAYYSAMESKYKNVYDNSGQSFLCDVNDIGVNVGFTINWFQRPGMRLFADFLVDPVNPADANKPGNLYNNVGGVSMMRITKIGVEPWTPRKKEQMYEQTLSLPAYQEVQFYLEPYESHQYPGYIFGLIWTLGRSGAPTVYLTSRRFEKDVPSMVEVTGKIAIFWEQHYDDFWQHN